MIAADLWRWARLPKASVDERQRIEAHLELLLEFYLCGLFTLIRFTSDRGIWCDGVADLCVERKDRCSFLLKGGAYCPNAVSPFELEIHFPTRMNLQSNREVLRLGVLDHTGELRKFRGTNQYQKHWPTTPNDWALHVEFTPK